jgi:hypothetical protein
MSAFGKRLRRRALVEAARAQRRETAGQGALRRPVGSWVLSTKIDLAVAALAAQSIPEPEMTYADDHTDD